jgi:hypothetical protein
MPPDTWHLTPGTCFSPEDRLILLLCRGHLTPELEAEARQLLLQPSAESRRPVSEFRNPQSAIVSTLDVGG